MSRPAATVLRALLVGIDRYLPPADGGTSPFVELGGCTHDVARMEAFLRRRVAGELDVETLVSAADGSAPAARHRLPTLAHLRAALLRLVERARPGEQALLFYAGHGARLKTAFPQLKGGPRGSDEALVPCDATHRRAPVLRDVELAWVLRRLVDGGVFVTVILDCCHAGGATRQAGGVRVRCAEALTGAHRPRAAGFGSDGELTAGWRAWLEDGADTAPGTADRNFRPTATSGWLPAPRGYVLLAACGVTERAHESTIAPGRRGGALTHALLTALEEPAAGEWSWSHLHARLVTRIHARWREQTPVLEGAAERQPFGGAVRPRPPAIPVLGAEEDGRLLLGAGRNLGLVEDGRLALYPPEATDLDDPAARLGLARVVEAGADRAWATVEGTAPGETAAKGSGRGAAPAGRSSTVPPSARAVLVDPGPRGFTTTVAPCTAGAGGEAREVLAAVGEAVRRDAGRTGGGFLRWCDADPAGATPDLQVAVVDGAAPGGSGGGRRLAVLDPGGSEIPLRPPLPARVASVPALVRRLVHLARFRALEALHNPQPFSDLEDRVRLELRRRHPDGSLTPLAAADGVPRVEAGWQIEVDLVNASRTHLHVALFVLRTDHGVTQLWPPPERAACELLESWTTRTRRLTAFLPEGAERGRAVLKLFAAAGATDYRCLHLPPLDHPLATAERSPAAATPLERLLAAVCTDRGRPGDRPGDLALGADHRWTTAQVATIVERPPQIPAGGG